MYDNNHGNVQQVFPVSTPNDCTDKPKTQHKNSICPIKPQCVEYNFIMAVLIHCEQLYSSNEPIQFLRFIGVLGLFLLRITLINELELRLYTCQDKTVVNS